MSASPTTLLQDSDYDNIRTAYPMLQLEPLTSQQEALILYRLRGMTEKAALTEAGYTDLKHGKQLLATPKVQVVLQYLRQQQIHNAGITTDMLNRMLIEAHGKSANTTEEVMAIRELGKLNDLYPAERKVVKTEIKQVESLKQLEKCDDTALIEMSGMELDLIPKLEEETEEPE